MHGADWWFSLMVPVVISYGCVKLIVPFERTEVRLTSLISHWIVKYKKYKKKLKWGIFLIGFFAQVIAIEMFWKVIVIFCSYFRLSASSLLKTGWLNRLKKIPNIQVHYNYVNRKLTTGVSLSSSENYLAWCKPLVFLSSPHVVGWAYCSNSVSFLLYQV